MDYQQINLDRISVNESPRIIFTEEEDQCFDHHHRHHEVYEDDDDDTTKNNNIDNNIEYVNQRRRIQLNIQRWNPQESSQSMKTLPCYKKRNADDVKGCGIESDIPLSSYSDQHHNRSYSSCDGFFSISNKGKNSVPTEILGSSGIFHQRQQKTHQEERSNNKSGLLFPVTTVTTTATTAAATRIKSRSSPSSVSPRIKTKSFDPRIFLMVGEAVAMDN